MARLRWTAILELEQQRILAAERLAPGTIPDHRRFTSGHLRDLAAGWEAGAATAGQSRLVKGVTKLLRHRLNCSIPTSHHAGLPALLKRFLVASIDDSEARVEQS
jgi:hypothetical protein